MVNHASPLITRIAPSPTGFFHLGTARTAYFNWLAARASGGLFYLRVDDTDATRNDPRFVAVIHQAMDYLDLGCDACFTQSGRTDRHRQLAQQLLQAGRARMLDGAVVLNHAYPVAPGQTAFVDCAVGSVPATQMDHDFLKTMVLLKSNGAPTYHFASVVDDIDYKVNVKQLALFNALDAPAPQFAHVGLLHDLATGKKLSKSAGAPSLLDYRDQGVRADAMCNFLLRLGWGPSQDDQSTAMLDRDRALALFLTGGRMRGASAKVDFQKLQSLNRKYSNRAASLAG